MRGEEMEDILKEINRLKDLNREMHLKSMLSGDVHGIQYSQGFEDALTNIEWVCYALDREYAED